MIEPGDGNSDEPARATDPEPRGPGGVRVLKSSDLLADAREVIIDHDGDHYRLRCTSKGKLILTK